MGSRPTDNVPANCHRGNDQSGPTSKVPPHRSILPLLNPLRPKTGLLLTDPSDTFSPPPPPCSIPPGRQRQQLDTPHHRREEASRQMALGQHEPVVSRVLY